MRLAGLVRFEAMIALVLIAVPIVLRVAGDEGSISAYHDMSDPRWFFVPLTAAAMMLVTNGLVYADEHIHYAILGALLIGVVLFDHDGASAIPHFVSAIAFFVVGLSAGTLMAAHYLRAASRRGVLTLAVAVGLLLVVIAFVTTPPVFWVEAVGVWLIAAYYIAHAWWEARYPADDTEPLKVLRTILPGPLNRLLGWLIQPFVWLWEKFNTQRAAASAPPPPRV